MREIRTSGLMSGEGKRGLRQRLKNRASPRLYNPMRMIQRMLKATSAGMGAQDNCGLPFQFRARRATPWSGENPVR